MIDVFAVVAPVFAIIAAGFVIARLGFVGDATERAITAAVFGVAIPTLLFRTMVEVSAPQASPWTLWGAYFGGVALSWGAAFALARLVLAKNFAEAVMAALGSSYSNTVLIGIPLVFSFFGETQSAVPLFLILSVNLPLMMLLGTVSFEWHAGSHNTSLLMLLWETGRRIVLNPVIIGLAAGLVFRQTGLGIVAPVQWVIDLIATAAAPAALFTMGVSLNRFGIGGEGVMCGVILAAKLVLHPLAVAILALWVFDLPPVWAGVAVLFAAAPTGINAFLLASRYQVAVPAISSAVAAGTAVSVVTITLISWSLGFHGLK